MVSPDKRKCGIARRLLIVAVLGAGPGGIALGEGGRQSDDAALRRVGALLDFRRQASMARGAIAYEGSYEIAVYDGAGKPMAAKETRKVEYIESGNGAFRSYMSGDTGSIEVGFDGTLGDVRRGDGILMKDVEKSQAIGAMTIDRFIYWGFGLQEAYDAVAAGNAEIVAAELSGGEGRRVLAVDYRVRGVDGWRAVREEAAWDQGGICISMSAKTAAGDPAGSLGGVEIKRVHLNGRDLFMPVSAERHFTGVYNGQKTDRVQTFQVDAATLKEFVGDAGSFRIKPIDGQTVIVGGRTVTWHDSPRPERDGFVPTVATADAERPRVAADGNAVRGFLVALSVLVALAVAGIAFRRGGLSRHGR